MNARARRLVSAIFTLAILTPAVSQAQEAGWTFRGTGEFGGFMATRDLAKNVGGVSELIALQASSRLDRSLAWGGGVEVMTPDGRTLFRGLVRGTVNGTASATLALCNVLEGELCIERKADSRLISMHGEVVFVQGRTEDSFRQNFILGAGLRSYQFRVEACQPSATNPDLIVLCELVQQIYENQAQIQGFIQFGFGVSYDAGPISLALRLNDIVGPYAGGSGNADGDFQNDVYLMTSMSFRIR